MKKILLISNRVMHYRVSVYNYLARRFAESDCELIVRSDELQKNNPHRLGFDFKEIDLRFSKYKREIERINPDVVIVFLHLKDGMVWPLVHWLKLKRIPVTFWTKGLNLDTDTNSVSYWLYKYMHHLCDGIILYSEHERTYINPRHWRKVFVANNTVNFDEYPEVHESKEEIKRDLGIPFAKVVLSVGRMGAEGGRKKIHHLIDVFRELDRDDVGLVIVGSGISADASAFMNTRNTLYLGEVYDAHNVRISRLFKMADVFCIPGHVGLGVNQAFYWGLPVVTEDGGQPPEIHYVIDGRNGFIVPNDDVAELKHKLLFLLNDDRVREQFSKNARADIVASASIANMFDGFKRCVDALIAPHRLVKCVAGSHHTDAGPQQGAVPPPS